jgi:hypothetical protein
MLEQILSNNSLKIIKRMLFSELIKLERKEKSLALSQGRNYHAKIINCEEDYHRILEAMYFYGIIK